MGKKANLVKFIWCAKYFFNVLAADLNRQAAIFLWRISNLNNPADAAEVILQTVYNYYLHVCRLSEPEDIDHLIKTSPPSDDEYQPDRFWNRDYSDGKRGYRHGKFNHRREYPDNHHGHRNFRHGYRDTHAPFRTAMQEPHHGYTRGKRGYQRTSKDYYSEPQDYSSGYDGDVYEDERYES